MALPSSTIPLRRAVMRALTEPTGMPRAIPHTNLFTIAKPGQGAQRAGHVKERPTAFVTVKDHQPAPDSLLLEMSDRRREQCTVEIVCTYWSGNDLVPHEVDAQLERIETDRQLVIAALCYPGALATDPDGQDTGLDGYSLRLDGYRSIGPSPLPMPGSNARVLTVTHTFRTTVELAQPT